MSTSYLVNSISILFMIGNKRVYEIRVGFIYRASGSGGIRWVDEISVMSKIVKKKSTHAPFEITVVTQLGKFV